MPQPNQENDFQALTARLRQGDPAAAEEVFGRFAYRLLGLAASKLDTVIRAKIEPADIVQSVFKSFFIRQKDGQFTLRNWDELWTLLTVITVRKCHQKAEYFLAARRDVRRDRPLPAVPDSSRWLWEAIAKEPSASHVAELVETLQAILDSLGPREREILERHLQGQSPATISQELACSQRKVYRVLERARTELEQMQLPDP